ncbi:ribulose-1,5 bisphosphate carboxylase oxygenase large subunit N-chloroplastic [Micractinium conductrix]|uniref:Ribulose-1,5 bisphosphate carboxylase oxygenase large subunit N-chloroplastic n=1 Tax=Micractinium conductrix TaxID=554055 RepID=A0A2P6VE41_9CHLO|nr:ribulose-1,5 bisphosphate carboxylase oxygenase large subunit N-chloroplastic [Micractinium conductrix]|eukprot:PSC72364.1 ribulose-1,5 bisphosphate carboxylase oxygenase large subunit N-chloroplastic [Micractinium conductrix]
MQPLLAGAAAQGLGPQGAFTREAVQWAFGMLLSRLVRLDSLQQEAAAPPAAAQQQQQQQQQRGQVGGGAAAAASQQQGEPRGTEALLPFADLLNHSPSCTEFLDWDAAEGCVVLRADQRYRPGEEVHVSYGQKSGGELQLSYGFCPRPADNPHDGCTLRLALPPDDPAAAWKAAALAAHGLSPSRAFPLRMSAAPFELTHYAAMLAAEVGSEGEAAALADSLFLRGEIPAALQQPALEAVVAACQAATKAYPCSFDEDRAELDRLEAAAATAGSAAVTSSAGGSGSGEDARQQRRRQVLQVLVYERQVLARTAFVLQHELKDLRRMARR